jgi:hypothetical protein
MEAFSRRKSVRITIAIVVLIWIPFLVRGQIYLVRQSNAWDLRQKMNASFREAQKSPSGLERAEKYLARLKAIHVQYAPDDLKQAFADYASGLQQAIEAAKANRDPTPFDKRMEAADQRIIAIEKRYDEYR